jgi:hypothetical protein
LRPVSGDEIEADFGCVGTYEENQVVLIQVHYPLLVCLGGNDWPNGQERERKHMSPESFQASAQLIYLLGGPSQPYVFVGKNGVRSPNFPSLFFQ